VIYKDTYKDTYKIIYTIKSLGWVKCNSLQLSDFGVFFPVTLLNWLLLMKKYEEFGKVRDM
jgi:hypothetical protein